MGEMAQRNYSSTAAPTTLNVGIGANPATDTAANVASVSGYPTPPFTAAIDRGTPSEECILVTAGPATTTWTIQRGYDGTTAVLHSIGARFEHCVAAVDYREANVHVNSTGAHGVAVVAGLDEAQTLTNKTLTAPSLNGIVNLLGSTGATADSRYIGAVNGAMPTISGVFGDWILDISDASIWVCTTAGAAGVAVWTNTLPSSLVQAPGRVNLSVKVGTASLTTDASGYTTWTHGCGVTPAVCLVEGSTPTGGNTIPLQHITNTLTTTTALTRWLSQTGVALASVAITFRWLAIYEAG